MTLVCRVEHRFPVAVVTLSGTLNSSTAIDAIVTLRGCLAEQPVQLVVDATHLVVDDPATLGRLTKLALCARRWPGTTVILAGADDETARALAAVVAEGALILCATAEEAMTAGLRLPVPPRISLDLLPSTDAPATCRELVAQACQDWQLGRWQRLLQLLASELVTNAVIHARTALTFTVRCASGTLQVAVRDGDPRLVDRPIPRPHGSPDREHGRGTLLLDALADDWGCMPTSDGKVMWASVSVAGRTPPEAA